MTTEPTAGKALRDVELLCNVIDATTAAVAAQKFPDAASLRISFSSVRSDTAFHSRSFSFYSSFSCFHLVRRQADAHCAIGSM